MFAGLKKRQIVTCEYKNGFDEPDEDTEGVLTKVSPTLAEEICKILEINSVEEYGVVIVDEGAVEIPLNNEEFKT